MLTSPWHRIIVPFQPRKVFRLSTITSRIRDLLLEASAKQFWIQAHFEIDKKGAGGHVDGNLIEVDARGKAIAKIRATIWGSDYEHIERKLQAAGMTDGPADRSGGPKHGASGKRPGAGRQEAFSDSHRTVLGSVTKLQERSRRILALRQDWLWYELTRAC